MEIALIGINYYDTTLQQKRPTDDAGRVQVQQRKKRGYVVLTFWS